MPLPSLDQPITGNDDVGTDLTNIVGALAALPNPPLEADLPAIIAIVADLNAAAAALQAVMSQILVVLSTTRVGQ